MKNTVAFLYIYLVFVAACKEEKKEDKKFISIVSLIKEQVADVDTSLYPILKITTTDSSHIDTTYIKREDFAATAKDFLSIPDLSDQKIAQRFQEEAPRYDDLLNRVIITYTPIHPEKETIKKQEMLVTPNPEGDKVNNIIVTREISNKDSFFQQKMLWQMNKYFQVITTRQKVGQPEETTVTKVSWNDETPL
ncbi:MAG TPA: hypothetical protein PKW62_04815 [Chitinophagaceae bacterium]|nr:hypothetical protein [Chitinophagaceae bacterium]HQV06060.1 hypothetical protein [Chitinophagaceae bacterium]